MVVSVCKERDIEDILQSALARLASGPYTHSAEVFYYCKCTVNRTVTGHQCANLPNVGREVFSHFAFLVELYQKLALSHDHLLLFINGGSGSKENAISDIVSMAAALASRPDAPSFIDGGATHSLAWLALRPSWPPLHPRAVARCRDRLYVIQNACSRSQE